MNNNLKYGFLIISCKRNVPILNVTLDSLCSSLKENVNIYVSFDRLFNYSYTDKRVEPRYCEDTNFGNRVLETIKSIPEHYIIVMCDDFVVEQRINTDIIHELLQIMDQDRLISCFALSKTTGKSEHDNRILEHYLQKTKYSEYKATLQATLWNTNAFKYLISEVQSPWEFEIFSNYDTYYTNNKYYSLDDDINQPIKYNRGSFAIRGHIVEPERIRLERVLGHKINIEGFPITDSYAQPSMLSFSGKAIRRIRMFTRKSFCYVVSIFKHANINL